MVSAESKIDETRALDWNYIVDEIAQVFRMTDEEKQQFKNSGTAQIIATIPFAAGCMEPERTAVLHLAVYISEIRGFQKYAAHLPSDDKDVFSRLGCIADFEGGNIDVIEHGMCLLALVMIEGYKRSEYFDKENKVYNPFVSGAWDYESVKRDLKLKLDKISCPDLDNLFTPVMEWYGI